MPFKIDYYDQDTIILSYFYDFIQVEIKATNIVSDLSIMKKTSSKASAARNAHGADLHHQLKYLNYPLQKVTCRSLVDSDGTYRPSIYASIASQSDLSSSSTSSSSSSSSSSRKVPIYVRYCIDLILGEIGEGDLTLTHKKYKYVRDLPMVI